MDPMTHQPNMGADEQKGLVQRVSEKVQQATDQARSTNPTEVLDSAKQKAADATNAASEKANDAMTAAGSQMSTLAQTVREKAPVEGRAGEIASNAADALDRGGRYLQQADPQMIRSDLEQMIRQHPVEAMLVGLGVGYLLARATRR